MVISKSGAYYYVEDLTYKQSSSYFGALERKYEHVQDWFWND